MSDFELVEYRPNRWVKRDLESGKISGRPTREEIVAWQSGQQAKPQELVSAEQRDPSETYPTEPPTPDAHPPAPGAKPSHPETPEPVLQPPSRRRDRIYPLQRRFTMTSSFQDHLSRTPPSSAPGLDYACPVGTQIRAWAGGRVLRSCWSEGGGRSLWIQHEQGFRSYYAHLDSVCVLEGETVSASQKIGESGNTGHTTGPHLHFSLMRKGEYIDPESLLSFEDVEQA